MECTLTALLREIVNELAKIDPDARPSANLKFLPPEKGEEIIGVANEDERRLLLLHNRETDAANELILKLNHMNLDLQVGRPKPPDFDEVGEKVGFANTKLDILSRLIEASVVMRLPPGRTSPTRFREGWKIVKVAQPQLPKTFGELLAMPFGPFGTD